MRRRLLFLTKGDSLPGEPLAAQNQRGIDHIARTATDSVRGARPIRRWQAQRYVAEGYNIGVDLDLEKLLGSLPPRYGYRESSKRQQVSSPSRRSNATAPAYPGAGARSQIAQRAAATVLPAILRNIAGS
jgi:hypothetical protein